MELNFKQFGQGDPIIILHGLFGMLDNWQTLAKKLAESYTVFIIDQRNHGRSPHASVFDYPSMAEDLHYFMESQWIYQAHLIGHSMGGKTVMQFALEYPDMVDRLVVVDIAPKKYEGGHQTIFEALFSLDLEHISKRKEAEEILEQKIPEFGVRQFLLKNLTRKKESGYTWKMNLEAIHNNYENILASIEGSPINDVSTLFIRGGKSDYIRDQDQELISQLFPKSSVHTIEGAGHWVHAEKPLELLADIRQFLD